MRALKHMFFYSIFLLTITNLSMYGQEGGKKTLADSVYSKELKQYREYTVYLPKTYYSQENKNYEYPIIYVLDGNKRKDLVHTIYQFLADNKRPMILESIIVAINQVDRSYELTPSKGTHFFNGIKIPETMNMGGADSFYKFIKNELHPEIQKKYRTNDFVNLVGHSFGGLFALHAMQEDAFFKGVIAIDPSLWWNNGDLVKEYNLFFKKNKKHNSMLFLAEAGPKEDNLHSISIEKFRNLIESHKKEMSDFESIFYKDKNHYTVLIPAIQDGLTLLLNDTSFRHLDSRMTKGYVKGEFNKKSSKIAVQLQPSPTRIVTYGDLCMMKSMPEKALEFYSWAIEAGVSDKKLEEKILRIKKVIFEKNN
ncbi:alpha/beta hydrolase [Aquimarina sp. I32.4]|uniref:alpha/beta hydrolase n=1 Tax=Aquimarina sp. I32.4 TaxID=2053903 RepID=UPI001304E5C7|nr:alpha/beta hydrolase-fold protein [Aquimarina sp. I32.4]